MRRTKMSSQFFHYETYSRTISKKSRGKKLTVKEVIDEVCRKKNDCYHVENPQEPNLIYGVPYNELLTYIDNLADNTKNNIDGRKIRKDQAIILAGVVSFPRELREQDEERYQSWIKFNIEYLKKKYGDNLINITEHDDEPHPHLHFYVMNKENCLKADLLHAGKVAKNQAYEIQKQEKEITSKKEETAPERQKMSKLSNRLYKEAMRKEQDEYWENVGLKVGLTRIGPGRLRLTRKEAKASQADHDRMYILQREVNLLETRKLASNDFVSELELQMSEIIQSLEEAKKQKQKEIEEAEKVKKEAEKETKKIGELNKTAKTLNVSVNRLKKEEKQLKNITKSAVGYGEKVNHFLSGLFGDSLQQKIDKAVEAIKREFDLKLKSKDDKIEEQQKTIKQQSKDIKEKDMKINNYDNLMRNNSREKRELQNKIGDLSNQLDSRRNLKY